MAEDVLGLKLLLTQCRHSENEAEAEVWDCQKISWSL
jgi:hypothetical protein